MFKRFLCTINNMEVSNMRNLVQAWIIVVFLQEFSCAQVHVEPREALVIPGQNITVMCQVSVPLQYCRVVIPGMSPLNLNPKLIDNNVSYYGQGLAAGQCGFTLNRVDESNNGPIKCTLGIDTEAQESIATMQLIVAKAPKLPELDLSSGAEGHEYYNSGEILKASCVVRDGRPVANLSWYLNDEPLYGEGLSMPTIVDMAKENLQSNLQNLTRTVQPSDNGKYLRCIAYHPAYSAGRAETKREIRVKYAPLPQREIERFGYVIGKSGVISVQIEANPRPKVAWDIGGERIPEGQHDQTGRIEAERGQDLGNGRFEYSMRIAAINKHDTEKMYILRAYNNMGETDYTVKISTSPEPEGIELGVGGIIGIVILILSILLVVFISIFAKVTNRWCFSGHQDKQNIRESSDTESADSQPRPRKPTTNKFTAVFKKTKHQKCPEEIPEELESKRLDADDAKQEVVVGKEVLLYAELDLVCPNKPAIKMENDKTEYAEIVYSANGETQATVQSDQKNDK